MSLNISCLKYKLENIRVWENMNVEYGEISVYSFVVVSMKLVT